MQLQKSCFDTFGSYFCGVNTFIFRIQKNPSVNNFTWLKKKKKTCYREDRRAVIYVEVIAISK